MVARIIAVERGLSPVQDHLREAGYQTVEWDGGDVRGADLLVVSGIDDDPMGIQEIKTRIPVIQVAGLSPEEVRQRIEETPAGAPGEGSQEARH